MPPAQRVTTAGPRHRGRLTMRDRVEPWLAIAVLVAGRAAAAVRAGVLAAWQWLRATAYPAAQRAGAAAAAATAAGARRTRAWWRVTAAPALARAARRTTDATTAAAVTTSAVTAVAARKTSEATAAAARKTSEATAVAARKTSEATVAAARQTGTVTSQRLAAASRRRTPGLAGLVLQLGLFTGLVVTPRAGRGRRAARDGRSTAAPAAPTRPLPPGAGGKVGPRPSPRPPREQVDAPPPPGRAVIRLATIALGTFVGLVAIVGVAATLGPPAFSSAARVVDVRLDIPEDASLPELEQRSVMYADDGSLLAVIDREVSRRVIPLERVPQHVRDAVITAEDRKFWRHPGYDVEGIARAAVANIQAGGVAEGGSTITQQLAKSEVGNERTIERKMTELLYAVALEQRFSKEELLERYLNQVYFGARAYGVQAAAEEFFGKRAPNLKVHEGALLAAMIRSPNSADPRDRPKLAKRRRNVVLAAMAEEGYLTPERAQRLQRRPLGVKESRSRKRRQPFVVDAVQREFLGKRVFGKTRKQRERALYYGGLRIHTSLDPQMQEEAREAILTYLPSGAPTGAIATVVPQTGEVKAIASGLDYDDLEYDLPTQGRRQPGSAFKPFVYAEAIRQGFPLDMTLEGDNGACYDEVPGWECDPSDPELDGVDNYGGSSYGTLDMREALTNSVNTAAAQLMLTVGPRNVVELADAMGIDMRRANPNPNKPRQAQHNPSIVLGGFERGTTPLEMASAYAVFANEGKRVRPHLISRVTDSEGRVLFRARSRSRQVLHPVVTAAMVDLMRNVVTSGTGTGAALPSWPVAGKTGTTQNNADAWFVGYTPVLSTAVWMGHAQGNVPMYGMTGGSTPASIWRTYMASVLDGRKVVGFPAVDLSQLDELRSRRSVTVPDVVGDSREEALIKLGERKLVGQVSEEYSSAPIGTVLWTSPSAGSTASPGDTVYVGVSRGAAPPPPPPSRPSGGGGGGGDDADDDEEADDDGDQGDDSGDDSGNGGDDSGNGGGDSGNGGGDSGGGGGGGGGGDSGGGQAGGGGEDN